MDTADSTTEPRNPAKKTRGRPFEPGNPGKPPGAKRRYTQMAEKMMADATEDVVAAVLAAARDGDMVACRLVLDRVQPVPRGRRVELPLPAVNTAADVLAALGVTIKAMAEADITPDEAAVVAGVLEAKRKSIETVELTNRLEAIERQLDNRK